MTEHDADSIRRLLHAYGDAVLVRDEAAWGALWTDDGVWDLGPDRIFRGREAVVAHWREAISKYRHVVQLYLGSTVSIDGDEAEGRAYLVELNDPAGGERRVFVGWYDDTYRRTVDGWRFSGRVLRRLYTGAPDLSGTFFTPDLG